MAIDAAAGVNGKLWILTIKKGLRLVTRWTAKLNYHEFLGNGKGEGENNKANAGM